jgi:glycosyltransferase involved in cell wall biosynthesis
VIPTGVDLDFFRPTAAADQPDSLVFTGAMDWMANEDAIFYFTQEVLPLIRKRIPKTSLLVVGRNPSSRLQELCRVTEGLEVTGRVEDIRPFVQRASVYIVPLRVGSGTRLKIFEAMAMGKAIVSTSIGAEGLPVRSGQNIMIADTPETFATAVVELLRNDGRRAELAGAARELVVERYGWGEAAKRFESVLEKLVETGIDTHAKLNLGAPETVIGETRDCVSKSKD